MGAGVAFGNSKAKVSPDGLDAPLDLNSLVFTAEPHFPSSPSKPPKKESPRVHSSAAYECLLFLQEVRHPRGRLSVQAHLTLDDPGQSPKPPPLPGATALATPPQHEEVAFRAELSAAANQVKCGREAAAKVECEADGGGGTGDGDGSSGNQSRGAVEGENDDASHRTGEEGIAGPSQKGERMSNTKDNPELLDGSEPDRHIMDLVEDESRQQTKDNDPEQVAAACAEVRPATEAAAAATIPPPAQPAVSNEGSDPRLSGGPTPTVSASGMPAAQTATTATTATLASVVNTTTTTPPVTGQRQRQQHATSAPNQMQGQSARLPLEGHAHIGPPQALPHDLSSSVFSDAEEGSPRSPASEAGDEAALAATAKGGVAWLTRQCVEKCTWKSAKSLRIPFEDRASYTLHLRVFDRRKLIAKLEEPLEDLAPHEVLQRDLPIQTTTSTTSFYRSRKFDKSAKDEKERRSLKLSFQVLNAEAFARRRVVYIVRHAESVWNAAQHNRQLYTMMSETDHGLSPEGGLQATQLSERLLAALKEPQKSPDVQELLSPDAVFVSPMCRAVQTAVLALGATLLKTGLGQFTLLPNAREKQNLGGMDSVSTKSGLAILEAVRTKLNDLLRSHEHTHREVDQVFRKLRFDISATEEQWWHEGKSERKASVVLRLREFMSQLLYSPHDCAIVVGHSLFFKALTKAYLSEEFIQRSPEFANQIATSKLQNCGIMRLELDSSRGIDGQPIVDARMVLGTKLITSKKK